MRRSWDLTARAKVNGKIRYGKLVVEEGGSWRARSKPVVALGARIGCACGGRAEPVAMAACGGLRKRLGLSPGQAPAAWAAGAGAHWRLAAT